MLEHKESFAVAVAVDAVWAHIHEMANWAVSLPGYQSYEVIDEKTSRWTLKVKLGALTRTVVAKVHVTEWREPTHVAFTFDGETEPITGSGCFDADFAPGEATTTVRLALSVSGSGSMAPAMEAMSRPVLPRLGRTFAEALRRDIERSVAASTPAQRIGPAISEVDRREEASAAVRTSEARSTELVERRRVAWAGVALVILALVLTALRSRRGRPG